MRWVALGFLTNVEVDYVRTISSALSTLTAKEIRALGTHCSAYETKEDILFNLGHWKAYHGHIVDSFGRGSQVSRPAYRIVTTAREVVNKSSENRQVYESAFANFSRGISGGAARSDISDAFATIQRPSGDIWNDVVYPFARKGPLLLAFSCYCRHGLSVREVIPKLGKKEIEEATASFDLLSNNLSGLTDNLWDIKRIKEGNGHDWVGHALRKIQ